MSIKSDLLKQISEAITRKKELAKKISKQKTVMNWACEFFTEINKFHGNPYGNALALGLLTNKLRTLDNRCSVILKEPEGSPAFVEIIWSDQYVSANNCEKIAILDEVSVFFQSALED